MNKKTTIETFELACRDMIKQATDLNIKVSGAIESKQTGLCGFGNNVESQNENMMNIFTLVKVKGDISEFLCELSRIEKDELDSVASITQITNPQINKTRH